MKILIKRTLLLLSIVVFTLSLAACGTQPAKTPTPAGEVAVTPSPGSQPPVETLAVALYFSDWQAQHVIPERRQIAKLEGAALATQVVKELLAGPKDPNLYRSVPDNVKLLSDVTLQETTAVVNLSKEFSQIQGSAGSGMAVDSFVLTLTDLPGVEKVLLLIDGQKGDIHGRSLDKPLTRGTLRLVPVLFDYDRAKALQAQANNGGPEAWRLDPKAVLEFEGRMFGFTADELKAATLSGPDDQKKAEIVHGGKTYYVLLEQVNVKGEKGIWFITNYHE